jgi:hypothetical protein
MRTIFPINITRQKVKESRKKLNEIIIQKAPEMPATETKKFSTSKLIARA